MRWKLYYGDGTTFCDADGSWEEAPSRNAQALVTEDDDAGFQLNEGSDGWIQNYVWWPGALRPWGVDRFGTLDYLVEVRALNVGDTIATLSLLDLAVSGVKIGRSIGTKRFLEIHAQAAADDYFPSKSARLRGEREA